MKQLILVSLLLTIGLTSARAEGVDDKTASIAEHIEIYNRVLKELEMNYVDSLDYKNMLEFSLDNMLYSLDPYTVYIPEKKEEDLKRMRSGEYGGIGAIVTQIDNKVYISSPYKNMAAQKADVRAGDMILSVDKKSTKGLSVSQVSDMLRGTPSTEIVLKLKREGEDKIITKKFKREIIKIDPVPYYGMVDDKTAIIVFNDFIDDSYIEFKKILSDLVTKQGAEKLIIDLRSNGGGLIQQSVEIASLFVPKGTEITRVITRGDKVDHIYKTSNDPLYPDMPVAFLVGDGTASAAEILSGALQDLDRALVFGSRSFGKGLVQSVKSLPYNTYLKITTAKYLLPSGRCIQSISYKDRKRYGNDRSIPDSLTNEYFTANGRPVRDLSGIMPDVKVDVKMEKLNIVYYLYMKNMFFQYTNKYVVGKDTIASAETFELTDEEYEGFKDFVINSDFTYRLESERYLSELYDLVKYEGLDVISDTLFVQLKDVLVPNVERDLELFKKEIIQQLEIEIVKRYYFHYGEVLLALKNDKELDAVMEYINDMEKWDSLLKGKREL